MNKHTPGPWEICRWDSKTVEARIQSLHEDDEDTEPEFLVVADVYGGDLEGSEAEANARLIAAAPDLLGALMSILDYAPQMELCMASHYGGESFTYVGFRGYIADAKAAIDKATGS